MAFWKKSEDPWDIDPEKNRRPPVSVFEQEEPEETPESLLDRLQSWSEDRKAEKARKLAESAPEPISCPWCGKLMESRYLWGGRGVYLEKNRPGLFASGLSEDNWDLLDEGNPLTGGYKTVWYCKDCRKLAADIPEPKPFDAGNWTYPAQTGEETTEQE